MNLFEVYSLFDITPVRGEDCYVWDDKGNRYLDLYGGHAVISVGHSHPHYVDRLTSQLKQIGFYSNSVQNPMQQELAQKLGVLSDMEDYQLFLCNSGAEANENALKLASFHTGRSKIVAFERGFHGRTSGAVAATDNPKIIAPFNSRHQIEIVAWEDIAAVEKALSGNDVAAVIIEGIQGIGGIHMPSADFLKQLHTVCHKYSTLLILDEIQSGYGRSGKFFAFQYAGIQPDIVTVAKGMGNGFPIGGVLIASHIKAQPGMLGTTFGGNYLACAAALAVIEIMDEEKLIENACQQGETLMQELKRFSHFKSVRGAGLMIAVDGHEKISSLRKDLLIKKHIFTGVSGTYTLRLLPPMTLKGSHIGEFISGLEEALDSG
ncbi:aminotransferase class III-fold pyridoxal phosphate-dependent enzyme [Carboxylicivirga mesophila]|uniref:Aminotransferase class III-fold pyridoxal phosphate-dependent enzyme n=1 Tax=Carboxylicivirga mesophila TaxID=1166478 RepID=A0ABS5K9L2_9BACT|nr:aminotransferase class III-fold pyridoxal phosphate-dependent enzyme [Carboxylicivirga mesophila]MBS2211686.1 aminotransferase class III-fold pyridoxal phosphate-dependent enzyme [Carboxylicivirga mesophila]